MILTSIIFVLTSIICCTSAGHSFQSYEKGVDISASNGEINWKALCSCGNLRFAFVKSTEGKNITDAYFVRNFNESLNHNLKTGIWHQFRTHEKGKDVTPEDQMQNIMSALALVDFNSERDMIAVATKNRPTDVEEEDEEDPALKSGPDRLSRIQMANRFYRLLKLINERTKVQPLIFTNVEFWNEYFHTEERSFIEFDLWVQNHIITYNISEKYLREKMKPRLPSPRYVYPKKPYVPNLT